MREPENERARNERPVIERMREAEGERVRVREQVKGSESEMERMGELVSESHSEIDMK